MPGCPEFAFCTASMDRARIVLTQSSSRVVRSSATDNEGLQGSRFENGRPETLARLLVEVHGGQRGEPKGDGPVRKGDDVSARTECPM